MVYRIDNRAKKHKGRNVSILLIIPVLLIAGYLLYQNHGSVEQIGSSAINTVKSNAETVLVNNIIANTSLTTQTTNWNSIALQIHSLVNQQREANGQADLNWDTSIASVATAHSEDELASNYYGHIDRQGQNPQQRLVDAGIKCGLAGENGDYLNGYSSSEIPSNVIQDWMGDEAHKMNVLGAGYTSEGIGISSNGTVTYVTEDFC